MQREDGGNPVLCWECETIADHLVRVTMKAGNSRIGPLGLCLSCYRSRYVPLVHGEDGIADMEAIGIDRTITGG